MSDLSDEDLNGNESELPAELQEIEYVNGIRRQIIEKTFSADKLPGDNVEARLLLDSLTGIERSAVSRMRLKNDKDRNNSMGDFAVALAAFVKDNVPNTPEEQPGIRDEPPGIDDALMEGYEVPDHIMSENDNQLTYQDFANDKK